MRIQCFRRRRGENAVYSVSGRSQDMVVRCEKEKTTFRSDADRLMWSSELDNDESVTKKEDIGPVTCGMPYGSSDGQRST